MAVGVLHVSTSNAQKNTLPTGSYVVVAAFSPHHEDYAIRLSKGLNKDGMHTSYGFEATRKYWYVYLTHSADRDACIDEVKKARGETRFADAWVHTIKGQDQIETVKADPEKKILDATEEGRKETPKEEPKVEPSTTETEVVPNPSAAPVYEPQNLKNTQVFLSLFNATNNEVIEGEVEVVNSEKGKLISRVKGNDYLILPDPKTKTGQLTLISNVFGFRKEQLEINYKNTEADTLKPYVTLVGNFYMVNFAMTQIHKGDISTLYNVYFFNDAAIMLPESKYQLNSLLELMQKSPTMKITLHGHTNGSGGGKIIYMGPSKNFFAITSDAKNGSGSAKALSAARAETIKQWLIVQGITEDRINVKGWGGGRMVYDKNSAYARKNIRVDVEVTSD
ncbi:MAG TPA: OmpA family protein [Cyclobacteriaceae bacterium]|nr:OmpA family protein [Cyclobacteriaceae bacterium]